MNAQHSVYSVQLRFKHTGTLAMHIIAARMVFMRPFESFGNLGIQRREQCVVLHSAYKEVIPTAYVAGCCSEAREETFGIQCACIGKGT